MPSHYSVIRYVPDPIAEEYLNIGVVAFEKDKLRLQFTKDWSRASIFGKENVSFLKRFASDLTENQLELFGFPLNENHLQKIFSKWGNSIQFSEIRGSVKTVESLLYDLQKIFLHEEKEKEAELSKKVNKQILFSKTYNNFCGALKNRFGKNAETLLQKGYAISGQTVAHPIDLAIVNHRPYIGAFTISFQVRDSVNLRNAVDAAAFAVEDVHRQNKEVQLALVAVPPDDVNESFERATKLFKKFKAPVIEYNEVKDWIDDAVNKLPSKLEEYLDR